MTVNDIMKSLDLKTVNLADGQREVTGGYVGDLLSWVMGRAVSGNAWVTIMTNVNVLAVASLTDAACVIIAEGSAIDEVVVNKAVEQNITLLSTELPVFDAVLKVYHVLS